MQASTPKGQFRPAGWVVTGPIGPPDSFRRDAMMALTPTKGSYISFPIPTKKGNPAKNDDFNILVLWSSYWNPKLQKRPWRGTVGVCAALLCSRQRPRRREQSSKGFRSLWLEASQFMNICLLDFCQRCKWSQAFVACQKNKGFWIQNRNDSTWISWKEAIPIKFWDTTNWPTWNRPRGWTLGCQEKQMFCLTFWGLWCSAGVGSWMCLEAWCPQ